MTRIGDDDGASVQAIGDALSLPVGESIDMGSNTLHLMCLGLDEPPSLGDTFELLIGFAERDPVTVQVAVENR